MKDSGDTIGNRTRDLPVCAVFLPTALLRAPSQRKFSYLFTYLLTYCMVQSPS